jgi:hypothetical protein
MKQLLVAVFALALIGGCKQPQTHLKLKFPLDADGGSCSDQTNLRCVNYLQFTTGGDENSSHCQRLPISLDNLCDLGRVAEGQEVFKLSPDTLLPIKIDGLRVYPATGCSSLECLPKKVFSGTTVGGMGQKIGDYVDGVIELPVTVLQPCGDPEVFFSLPPEGGTCAEVCHAPDLVVCDHVQGGCLCKKLPSMPVFQDAGQDGGQDAPAADGRQGGIDSGP